MARKSIDDCRCEIQRSWTQQGSEHWDVLQYNPRSPFHKGPDKGYGYDQWGRPNSKHSETVGKVGAVFVLCVVVSIIVFFVALALGAFG